MLQRSDKPKVICLGLGRTGTSSLRQALEILGFGPAYHMSTIIQGHDPEEFARWRSLKGEDEESAKKRVHELLNKYGSALDYPMVMYSDTIYATYPDAKYILSTRDPAKWEKSMKATILRVAEQLRTTSARSPMMEGLLQFYNLDMLKFHHGRIYTDTQQELLDHEARIKALIPSDKLLIYEVSEGWGKLVEFLGVSKPDVPFPHINDTAQFQVTIKTLLGLEI